MQLRGLSFISVWAEAAKSAVVFSKSPVVFSKYYPTCLPGWQK
jgi:hypothetical protein